MPGLKCQLPQCSVIIHAMTGLQEIQKLISHIRRAHGFTLSWLDALDLRVEWETAANTGTIINSPMYRQLIRSTAVHRLFLLNKPAAAKAVVDRRRKPKLDALTLKTKRQIGAP
jgi:hypothetical protein